jgi:hypothetical protein
MTAKTGGAPASTGSASTPLEAVLHFESAAMDGRIWTSLFAIPEKQVVEA